MSSWFLKETGLTISGYKETGEIEYAADTALDHMAVTDENESPVEVHITKNRHFKFKSFAGELQSPVRVDALLSHDESDERVSLRSADHV